jgi:hypothetical protein
MPALRDLSRLATALCALTMTLPSFAGRPLQTEDAGVLDRGACELEGAQQRLRVLGETGTETGLTANCGIGFASQVGLGLGWARTGGERSRSGGLGGKTGLWAGDGDGAPALTLAWGLGADREDGRWRRSDHFATLVASIGAGPGTLHLNLGHVRERQPRRALTTWNVAWEHDGYALGSLTLAPMGEVFGDDRGDRWWNLAARLTLVPERVFVDVSWGRQINAEKARLVTAGFKVTF